MMGMFTSIIQLFGLLGLYKYIMDQATMNAMQQMLLVLQRMGPSTQ